MHQVDMPEQDETEQPHTLDLIEKLVRLGVSETLSVQVSGLVPHDTIGVLLYGSRARGDWIESSDLDLIALVKRPRGSTKTANINLSCYTKTQLRSASGTIFGFHLSRDGVIVVDTENTLKTILAGFADPDSAELRRRICQLSALLITNTDDQKHYLTGLCRLARYLLRTAVYLAAITEKRPCFSIRELAERYADPSLVTILASDPAVAPKPSVAGLNDLLHRLKVFAGQPTPIPETSLEDIAVTYWDNDNLISQLAIMAMANKDTKFDYSQLPKVLL